MNVHGKENFKIKITFLIGLFWVVGNFAVADAPQLEIFIKRNEALINGFTEFKIQFTNHTKEKLVIKDFRSGHSAMFVVDMNGIFFPDVTYAVPSDGGDRLKRMDATFEPGGPETRGIISMKKGGGFHCEKAGVYFLVFMIRKPYDKPGVIISAPTRFVLNAKQEIGEHSTIPVSELPLKVKATFLKEIITRLGQERSPIIKEDIPFY